MGLRALRRLFSAPGDTPRPFTQLTAASVRVEGLLRVFYVFPLYWYLSHLDELRPLLAPRSPDLRWPVKWLEWVGIESFAPVLLAFGIATALLGTIAPGLRGVRFLVFFGLLEVLALKFSYGKVHHLMHGWRLHLLPVRAPPEPGLSGEGREP
ncbi:MAG: hypothetical protein HC923_04900 [Myxococcales bacterium]|nr:hypothetical protein [Myxococcales bacterium]